jgi:hypothetical protein
MAEAASKITDIAAMLHAVKCPHALKTGISIAAAIGRRSRRRSANRSTA